MLFGNAMGLALSWLFFCTIARSNASPLGDCCISPSAYLDFFSSSSVATPCPCVCLAACSSWRFAPSNTAPVTVACVSVSETVSHVLIACTPCHCARQAPGADGRKPRKTLPWRWWMPTRRAIAGCLEAAA
ncbi:hypothetical protein EV126DRAFT_111778 [Verticillium dahliae]|nr:hypothetical protein EV126DRAFT_111778 [Verticillium dahliae]